jgi:hypothetical protein
MYINRMAVPGDCENIQKALREATVVLGEAAWKSVELQLQTVYHIRLEPPCSTVQDVEKALFDLLGKCGPDSGQDARVPALMGKIRERFSRSSRQPSWNEGPSTTRHGYYASCLWRRIYAGIWTVRL